MNEGETGGGGPAADAPPPRPSFPEPGFSPPGWPPQAGTGLDARPHILQGAYWVSFDHQHWWNGSMWVPGPPPSQPGAMLPSSPAGSMSPAAAIVALVAIGLLVLFAAGICMSMPQSGFMAPPAP